MNTTNSLTIRSVKNGYVVTVDDRFQQGMDRSCESEHVFTDSKSLGLFVSEFYKGNAPAPASYAAEPPVLDPEHNPAGLSAEQVGVSEGWRLLRLSEVHARRDSLNIQKWDGVEPSVWNDSLREGSNKRFTYRTKLPFGHPDLQ